jgi:hypothetical protein
MAEKKSKAEVDARLDQLLEGKHHKNPMADSCPQTG